MEDVLPAFNPHPPPPAGSVEAAAEQVANVRAQMRVKRELDAAHAKLDRVEELAARVHGEGRDFVTLFELAEALA